MRRVRDYAADGVRPYHTPDRPRVADPARRRQIGGYLEGGTALARSLRTDGVWVWPQSFVGDILELGLAPEPDLLGHMTRAGFTADAPPHDDELERAARAAVPQPAPPLTVDYFVRVDDGFPPEAPLSLLRRVRGRGGIAAPVDEALWRDLEWHPTHTFTSRGSEYDLREVTEAHAAEVIDRWCAKWHSEWRE